MNAKVMLNGSLSDFDAAVEDVAAGRMEIKRPTLASIESDASIGHRIMHDSLEKVMARLRSNDAS